MSQETVIKEGIAVEGSPKRVLVVAPEGGVHTRLVELVQEAWEDATQVETVFSGQEALQRLEEAQFDLCLLAADGSKKIDEEVVRRIRDRRPELPLIFLLPTEDWESGGKAVLCAAEDWLIWDYLSAALLRRAATHARTARREWTMRLAHERQLRELIQRHADGILVLSQNGRVRFANPAAEKLLDRTKQELIAQPLEYPLADGGRRTWEVVRKDGRRTLLEARSAPIEWDHEPAHLVSLRDITEMAEVQEQLRQANEELRRVLRSARCLLLTAIVREEGGSITWDLQPVDEEAAQRFLPLDLLPGESYHEAWYRARHPIDRAKIDIRMTPEFLRDHSSYQHEFRVIDRFGNTRWLREEVAIEPIGEGKWHVTAVCTDITDIKEVEEQLRRSEERFRAILTSLPDMIFHLDAEGRIIDFIPGEAEPLVPPEEFLGKPGSEFLSDEVIPVLERARQDAVQLGATQSVEYPLEYPDGVHWFEARFVADGQGGAYVVVRDVSERKRMEEQLRAERDRNQLYLNLVGSIVVALDRLGRVTMINRRGLEVLGWEESQVLGKVWFDYFLPETAREPMRQAYRALIEEGSSNLGEVYECPLITRDGSERFVRWHHAILYDREGRPTGLLISGEDITELRAREYALQETQNRLRSYQVELERRVEERTEQLLKAKEEAERASRAKSEFLSRMSHELRTPLNVILGFAQLLELDVEPGSQAEESVRQILQAGRHLLQLIEEVLDLSRIEAGKLVLETEEIPLSEAVAEVIELLRPLASQRQITINNYVDELPYRVLADRRRLRQVILNLLSNAIKYNREAGIVTITASVLDQENLIRLSVADTGPGIPEEQQGRVFEPFERLGAEESGIEGTGIGLVTSKQLIEAMGGRIGFRSTVGAGSTFWVDIPLAEGQLDESPSPEPAPAPEYRVLYIEDNAANIRLVERILDERPDIEVLSAPSAPVGIQLAREHRPDLILLDLNLPGMDGFEAYKRLQEDPRTQGIPVVAVTARAMPEDIQRGEGLGFVRYLTKPIAVDSFLEMIRELLPPKTGEKE